MLAHARYFAIGVLFAGCATDDRVNTREVQQNQLGVTSIETVRTAGTNDDVFELRGFDASQTQVASVRVHTGTIADLPAALPGGDAFGSEIIVSVRGLETRALTRETSSIHITPVDDASVTAFLAIPEVVATLAQDIDLTIVGGGAAPDEVPFASLCTSNLLLTSPTAFQCCYTGSGGKTVFVKAGGGNNYTAITRLQNPHLTGCKASDGVSACTGGLGKNCYYGPFGFARPTVQTPPTGTYWPKVESTCSVSWYNTVVPPVPWGNVTGSNPVGQGCPGGMNGAYDWDY